MSESSAAIAEPLAIEGPPVRDERRVNLLVLCCLALVIGVMTGVGAVALRYLIGLFHNLFYNGTFSFLYDANISEGPSWYGNWVFLAPVIGGLIVVFLVERFAPEAKGHGVPEVMDAVFYKGGNIRGQVAVIKSLASALSIGSGAAVGREGPIIQIGAALGSAFSQAIHLSPWQKVTLLSAGAGAGIAATFNTPLGGVLFALEILLPEVSNRTFLPVVIATGAATMLGRLLIGPAPAFVVPDIMFPAAQSFNLQELAAFVLLGILCGVAAWMFIRLLVFMEDWFPTIPGGIYVQNLIGMSVIGLMMVVMMRTFGHPYVDGVGYGVIQSVLDHSMTGIGLLLLLFVMKLLATTISLGCGASGGIFSPSLYLGATLGGSFAAVAGMVLPNAGLTIPSAAIVGMAAMVGAGTGGVMTAIVMVFEMTRDYAIIVPVIVAVAVAAGVRRTLIGETIYTVKLRHRGHRIPKERHINLYLVRQAQDIMERRYIVVTAGTSLKDALSEADVDDLPTIIVEREGRIAGLVPPRSGLWRELRDHPDILVDHFAERRMVLCRDVDLLSRVFGRLKIRRSGAAIVFHGERRPRVADIVGVVTKRAVADAVIDSYHE
ncbi:MULTISPECIES: chloride channel protein [Rhodopseudomonas]|nr:MULTISPECIES: chloride channel protein [Rhodopseudomonas]MDF3808796.1 chloride channel protein [Rhodopseudomonas sp. BAL398]WOK19168.1 chloride channel protein [Rhodopseudomonas sp. BAL398]